MNKLDINGFYRITSFLKPLEIKTLGTSSRHVYNNCLNFMTYLYSEHGCNESYYKMNTAKWIVYECDRDILSDCVDKNLAISCITLIVALTSLSNRSPNVRTFDKLHLVNFSTSPSKPSPTVQTFNKLLLASIHILINPSKPLPTVHPFNKLLLAIVSINQSMPSPTVQTFNK
jgi:hypothetical protein